MTGVPFNYHGTAGGYSNHKCKCPECTEANRIAQNDYMERHPEQREKLRMRERARRKRLREERMRDAGSSG